MENKIVKAVEREKIIVIVRGVPRQKLLSLAEAMYNGGIRLLEVTYSADGTPDDEQTASSIKMLKEHFGDSMFVGAGTVLAEKQVSLTKQAGGEFIISPDTEPSVIQKTKELGMVSIPGAYTPSEIRLAHTCGADFVKIFPAADLGVRYIKAVKAPLSNIKLLAVGGIQDKDMKKYLDAGVCGFGIGSNIVDNKLIASNDFAELAELARRYTAAVNGY